MLYLLDANVLITAERNYYPIARVPEFWDWLLFYARMGVIKMPSEILDEVLDGRSENDPLLDWLKTGSVKDDLLLREEAEATLVRQVIMQGYAPDLDDSELESLGKDPFLVAYGLVDPGERKIVSIETSRPSCRRANRKVPDVCRGFHIDCLDPFKLCRELDFTTSWRSNVNLLDLVRVGME